MTTQDLSWDLAGRLVVGAQDLQPAQVRAVAALLDPFEELSAPVGGDITLTTLPKVSVGDLRELHGPARDGRTTARTSDGRLLARFDGAWATVPAYVDGPAQVALEAELNPSSCWADVVRPAMQLGLHRHSAVAVHAAAVEHEGTAVLLAGWSESGKTEVALGLVEQGCSFLSDKWTVAGTDGQVSAFPVKVGVRGWVLPALPRLRSSLPRAAQAQLTATRALELSTRRARRMSTSGRVTSLTRHALTRAVQLGDRAGVSQSALRAAYEDESDAARRVPLGTVVLLVTGPGDVVVVEELDSERAAVRLARSAAYERRAFFDLQERGAYAGLLGRSGTRDACMELERGLLQQALTHAARVLLVTCPFPGDPRRVVDALAVGL